jgi:hypothetical protein
MRHHGHKYITPDQQENLHMLRRMKCFHEVLTRINLLPSIQKIMHGKVTRLEQQVSSNRGSGCDLLSFVQAMSTITGDHHCLVLFCCLAFYELSQYLGGLYIYDLHAFPELSRILHGQTLHYGETQFRRLCICQYSFGKCKLCPLTG